MIKKISYQKDVVENELKKNGYVRNDWCINNGIWRLSSLIHRLRKQGYKISQSYLKDTKISIYKIIK